MHRPRSLVFNGLTVVLLILTGSGGLWMTVQAQEENPLYATANGPLDPSIHEERINTQPTQTVQTSDPNEEITDETLSGPAEIPVPEDVDSIEEDISPQLSPSLSTTSNHSDGGTRGSSVEDRTYGLGVLDNFNRTDGALGSNWTTRDPSCSIVNNGVTCSTGMVTFNGYSGDGNAAEMDVAAVGATTQYAALLLNYGAGVDNLFIKIQQSTPLAGQFTHVYCYTGHNGPSFGPGGYTLTSPFTTAHMRASRVWDTVTIEFTHIDNGTLPDQTYVCGGAPAPEGTGIGMAGYVGTARMDNFAVPQGPKVLLLESDFDVDGGSDIQTDLESFMDLDNVDLFDAGTGTPSFNLLNSYDVVVTWSNYSYTNPTGIGNILADYVDAGGKVINIMFALGDTAWSMQGRFMAEDYTALQGTFTIYSTACMDFASSHPVMNGITNVCDFFRLGESYVTPGSTKIATWDDGEVFVAAKNDRSVVSIAGYVGLDHVWTGQMNELVHNAIYWLFTGNEVLWNQPHSVIVPGTFFANQEMPDMPDYSSFGADDFFVTQPWSVKTIFIPGGWHSDATMANASEVTYMIYEDDSGEPAGDPSGGGDPPIWALSLPISDPHLTLYSGLYDGATNIILRLPVPLTLLPGHYWLVMWPTMPLSPYGQLGRAQADTTNGHMGLWINPGGGFGYGTAWQPFTVTGATQYDMAFRIEGVAVDIYLPLIKK